jgi:hypothetical protein
MTATPSDAGLFLLLALATTYKNVPKVVNLRDGVSYVDIAADIL